MKRGELLRVKIEHLGPDGNGEIVIDDRKISVKGALPGDTIDLRINAVKRSSARGKIENLVESEIERRSAKCSHFNTCGGCRWQDVDYTIQLELKTGIVRNGLADIPGLEIPSDISVVPSPDEFFFRNKMEFSFDSPPRLEGKVLLGLHETGRYDSVFDLETCYLQSELSNKIVTAAREFVRDNELNAYGLKSHVGLLRYLMIRDGKASGDLMINVVTSGEDFPLADDFAAFMHERVPEASTVMRSINDSKGGVTYGESREVLYGEGTITEKIGDCEFRISPDSFFQTNPRQTTALYDCIKEFARIDGSDRLLDLYCGTGTIGIYLAGAAKEVAGIEMVEDAVRDAEVNARLNNVDNVTFTAGLVEKMLDESHGVYDVVVCDPPRVGIHPKALARLLELRIPRMVYVSCNIKALPKDLEMLAMAGYKVTGVKSFDMSPHTAHVETVVGLEIG